MRALSLLAIAPVAVAAGCGGASTDTGLDTMMRLSGAQFIPGELDTASDGTGPTMQAINVNNTVVFPGAVGRSLGGSANASTAVLIGLGGDSGHWVAPTGVADTDNPGAFLFTTTMSFSPLMPPLPVDRSIIFRAVDAHGTIGPPTVLGIKVQSSALSTPAAALEITLNWDAEADLDLKVRVPNAADPTKPIDVWTRSRVALPPVGNGDPPHTDQEIAAAGQLDYDSNAQCVIDGLRTEDVIFPQAPPSGAYEVRVDAFSMCGQVGARWHVLAHAGDQMLGEAYGQASDFDARGSHGPATGTLAFTFTVP